MMERRIDKDDEEAARIERAYERRAVSNRGRYAPDRPEVVIHQAAFDAAIAEVLLPRVSDISETRFLDVGCGGGSYLRKILDLGANPKSLTGTELLGDRLADARRLTPEGPHWHLGPLRDLPDDEAFDVVSAFTVFSSILDDDLRQDLADEMWRRTAADGVVIIYDFKFNNPSNSDVRKVTRAELEAMFPEAATECSTMTLAPPISRPIAKIWPGLVNGLSKIPPLRSHFLFIARRTA